MAVLSRGTAGKQGGVITRMKCCLQTRRKCSGGVVLGHISMGVFSMTLPTGKEACWVGAGLVPPPPSLFSPLAGALLMADSDSLML